MSSALKILLPAIISFISGILITPVFTHYFYKYKLWRKKARIENVPEGDFSKIYEKTELSTPRVGGIIIWASVICTILVIGLVGMFSQKFANNLYFINRTETLLPFFTLIMASLIGLGDDFIQIFTPKFNKDEPIYLRYLKILIILILGFIIGLWFYNKLGINYVHIPFGGNLFLGLLFVPLFVLIMLGVFSSSIIDGLDGLSGGVLAPIFFAYSIIAFSHGQINLATFCAVVGSAVLAFLWFNIPPARFYMGETGMIGLTVTLSVIAFLTNTVLLLPIIAFPLFITSLSAIIQIFARKCFNKKVFLVAPLHHHFEALGWPKYKVTMRFWIIGIITSIIGVIIAILN